VYTHRPDGAQPPRRASVASPAWTGRAVGLLITQSRAGWHRRSLGQMFSLATSWQR
jgi:hypothetical protein